jgi:2'-5' RNA ligase
MRLFLGIDLPQTIKQQIHSHLIPLKLSEKGWEDPRDYHQTLLFIGEAPEEILPTITRSLEAVTAAPFELHTNGFQFFNRRVMYLGFKASEQLMGLKKEIDDLFPEWSGRETKTFIPHVTVKRWQRYEYEHLNWGLKLRDFQELSIPVNEVCLFKSEKDAHHRKYHVIFRQKLKE